MIELFRLQDRDVSQKLQDRVRSLEGLVLVSGVKQGKHMRPVEEREPFVTIEARFGQWVSWLVVVEEESTQIAWRDPLGDLGSHVFPTDRAQAYAAATGYLLLKDGAVEDIIKKQGAVEKDLWNIQEALAAAHPEIPRPGQATKRASGPRRPAPAAAPPPPEPPRRPSRPSRPRPAIHDPEANEPTPPLGRRATGEWDVREEKTPVPVVDPDPWAVLGVAPGTPVGEVRKAFRALMVQYHPDKVAHLAAEFRELAEKKSRQITEAWEKIRTEGGEQADE